MTTLRTYFGQDGLGYSIGWVPIGGTDFSDRPYTLCDLHDADVTDPDLVHFALQDDDRVHKVRISLHSSVFPKPG